jgi:LPXTG-motif cell wall-anchored protein
MKKFKKLSALLIAAVMVLTMAVPAMALDGTETAEVKVTGLVKGDKVNFYRVAEPTWDASKNLTGYRLVEGFVDEADEVTLTLTEGTKTYTITKPAGELDADGDGKVDAKITLASVTATAVGESTADTLENKEWTVGTFPRKNANDVGTTDTAAAGAIIYNMLQPKQEQIALALTKLTTADYADVEAADDGVARQEVTAGEYIAVPTPVAGNQKTYNPVVVSAGYKGAQKYVEDDTTPGTFFKKKDGSFTTTAPAADTWRDYANVTAWDEEANPKYVTGADFHMYKADGETTEDQLIAKHIDMSAKYDWKMEGTTAIDKSQTPKLDKEAETEHNEGTKEVPVLITLANGDTKLTGNKQTYLKAPYTSTEYAAIQTAADDAKFKLVDGKYVVDTENAAGSVDKATALAAAETTEASEATLVTSEGNVYNAGQGELINYTLTPNPMPQYPTNATNKTFVINDTFSAGISYVHGSLDIALTGYDVVKVHPAGAGATDNNRYDYFYKNGTYTADTAASSIGKYYLVNGAMVEITDTNVASVPADTQLYTLFAKYKHNHPGTPTFQVNFIYDALPGTEGAKVAPTLTYQGVINENGVTGIDGNLNIAKMFFAKNSGNGNDWNVDNFEEPSGDDYNERHDEEKVYTYNIRFRKTNDEDMHKVNNDATANFFYALKDPYTPNGADADAQAAQQAAYDALKAAATKSVKADGTVLWLVASDATPTTGALADYADTANKYVANSAYTTLEGAVFGLYEEGTNKLITEITVGPEGIANTTLAHNGSYYLKELVPPTGYTLSNTQTPVTVNWESSTIKTTDTVTRKVYTVKVNEAMDMDGDGVLPEKNANAESDQFNWSNAAANVFAEDQVGWLVGTDANAPFYELKAYDVTDNTKVTSYNEETHIMVLDDGSVVRHVFRAYMKEEVTTTTVNEETVYNNTTNGGTTMIDRINNTKSPELPSTGGMGTYLFTIAGIAIMGVAAFMLIFKRRRA